MHKTHPSADEPKKEAGGWFYAALFGAVFVVTGGDIPKFWNKHFGDERPAPPSAPPARPTYVRPALAPNGRAWPTAAGYLGGYRISHRDGASTLTVDNTRNDTDVFVKLVSLQGERFTPVRYFFIPAAGRFTLDSVSPGSYDIRYRDLGDGGLARSEPFTLEETATYGGIQYSEFTMTLYKVSHGNMRTFGIAENEF